jgi:hypothetical protein
LEKIENKAALLSDLEPTSVIEEGWILRILSCFLAA